MNLLPFVFTFLLLLTLLSSFLFSSVLATARESRVILTQHHTYLQLLSEQNKAVYKLKREKKAKKQPSASPSKRSKPSSFKNRQPRSEKIGLEKSKLNLYYLIHGNDPSLQQALEKISISLIENLYGTCDFYRSSSLKNMAQILVKKMEAQSIQTFEELDLTKENLDPIYYKMLKGTNTGYPALKDYFRISAEDAYPIYFQYASLPVLQALLGDKIAQELFDLEKSNWSQNKRYVLMTRKEFEEFLRTRQAPFIPHTLINFDNKTPKGIAQIRHEKNGKIRAVHKV